MADDPNRAVPARDQSKTCTKCGGIKSLDGFSRVSKNKDGRSAQCRECQKVQAAEYYAKNRDRIRQRQEKHCAREEYKQQRREYHREYYERNREAVNARIKAQRAERPTPESPERKTKKRAYMAGYTLTDRQKAANARRSEIWNKDNPERRLEIVKRHRQKRRASPKAMLENFVRNGVYRSIRHGSRAGRRTFAMLGYSVKQWKRHIERQFLDDMSWANYGDWHIDHIIPLAAFNYETPDHGDFKRAWALSNLQPLWASDNKRKNAKLTKPFQPSLLI